MQDCFRAHRTDIIGELRANQAKKLYRWSPQINGGWSKPQFVRTNYMLANS
jgi:hypothetical protein